MELWKSAVIVGVGGFLGSIMRFLGGHIIPTSPDGGFPIATFIINVSGSFLIGIVMGVAAGQQISPNWRIFLAVGVLGGFTTYSAFAYETVSLIKNKSYFDAIFYFFGTGFSALFACFVGALVAHYVFPQ